MKPLEQLFRTSTAVPDKLSGLVAAAVFVLLACPPASAQRITGRLITSAVTWEKIDTVGSSHKVLRGFESALFDISKDNMSLHTNLQVGTTTGNDLSRKTDYRIFSLFARMKDVGGAADISLGRIPFYMGVGLGTVDGALVTLHQTNSIYKVSLYGGATSVPDYGLHSYGRLKDKFTLGGQVFINALPELHGSLSYINRRSPLPSYYALRADPQTLDPVSVLVVPDPEREQLGGMDLSYAKTDLTLYGRYDHNFELGKLQRAQFGARYSLTPEFFVTLDAARREPLVPVGTIFSQFTLKGITEIEVGEEYFICPELRTFLRGAFVGYDGATSFRYSAGVGRSNIQLVLQGNTGYAGELTSVSVNGAYPILKNCLVPNAGFSYMSYRVDRQSSRYDATSAVLGATLRPVETFSLDLQGQWLNNYIVKSDFRFVGRLQYWFSESLNFFE